MNDGDRDLPVEDPTAAALRGALARQAETIEGRPDGLLRIRAAIDAERTGGPAGRGRSGPGPWSGRRPGWAATAGLVAVAACVALVAGLVIGSRLPGDDRVPVGGPGPTGTAPAPGPSPTGGPTPGPTGSASGSSSGTSTASPTGGTAGGGAGGALPVYYPAPVGAGFGLYREYHEAPAGASTVAERVQAAVTQAMSRAADDPDYRLLWDEGAGVEVGLEGDLITVRLNQAAAGGTTVADPGADVIAVQQLIWTATAAAVVPGSPGPYRVLIRADGPTPTRFGGVDLTRPFERGAQPGAADPRAPLWIDSLGEGAVLAPGTRRVTGQGIGGPFDLRWTLTRDGAEVGSGTVRPTTASGAALGVGLRGVWSLDLQLDRPGDYRLEMAEDVPADAGGGSDSKSFVVR